MGGLVPPRAPLTAVPSADGYPGGALAESDRSSGRQLAAHNDLLCAPKAAGSQLSGRCGSLLSTYPPFGETPVMYSYPNARLMLFLEYLTCHN